MVLDWTEQAGKAVFALAMMQLKFLKIAQHFKKHFWSENNYRNALKTNPDKKDL